MRDIALRFGALLVVAVSLGCGDDQQGPGADGPLFFTAAIDGVPWSPDSFAARFAPPDIHGEQAAVIFQARRETDAGGSEVLSINSFMDDLFSLTSYRLDTGGPGEAAGLFQQVSSPADVTSVYATDEEHTGTLRLTGANATDSVVSGGFGFEAEDAVTGEARRFRGEFRVRYRMYE